MFSDMIGIQEKSLNAALEAASLQQTGLPKIWRGESDGFWVEAVVLVRKRNGDKSYMLARRGADRLIRYARDCGRMSPVVSLVSIFPYKYLDTRRFDPCKGDEGEQRKYLAAATGKPAGEVAAMTAGQVQDAINADAIARQSENDSTDMGADKLAQAAEDNANLSVSDADAAKVATLRDIMETYRNKVEKAKKRQVKAFRRPSDNR